MNEFRPFVIDSIILEVMRILSIGQGFFRSSFRLLTATDREYSRRDSSHTAPYPYNNVLKGSESHAAVHSQYLGVSACTIWLRHRSLSYHIFSDPRLEY